MDARRRRRVSANRAFQRARKRGPASHAPQRVSAKSPPPRHRHSLHLRRTLARRSGTWRDVAICLAALVAPACPEQSRRASSRRICASVAPQKNDARMTALQEHCLAVILLACTERRECALTQLGPRASEISTARLAVILKNSA